MKLCPFCQECLLLDYKEMSYSVTESCPNGHYDYYDLADLGIQERFLFKEFNLIINNPPSYDNEPWTLVLLDENSSRPIETTEIRANTMVWLKPFQITFNYDLLKRKIETMLVFK